MPIVNPNVYPYQTVQQMPIVSHPQEKVLGLQVLGQMLLNAVAGNLQDISGGRSQASEHPSSFHLHALIWLMSHVLTNDRPVIGLGC